MTMVPELGLFQHKQKTTPNICSVSIRQQRTNATAADPRTAARTTKKPNWNIYIGFKPETREALGLGGQGVGTRNGGSPGSERDPGRWGARQPPPWKWRDTPTRPSASGCNV